MFIGRTREIEILQKQFTAQKASLFVLYGRRRVGKTELLRHFCRGKEAIYFVASQIQAADNLSNFIISTQTFLPYAPEGILYTSIIPILEQLTKMASTWDRKLILVLDEFQYWVNADSSLPSRLQNFWDAIGKDSNLMLILCGSSISLMVDQVLAEKSPLYGRRTGQLQLKPFDYRTASQFVPNYSVRDKLMTYGVLGGMPAYWAQFDSIPLQDNIEQQILQKGTFLNEEISFLLKTELRDTKTYASLLKTIAAGNTTIKDIASKMNMDARGVSFYLGTLQELQLVKRVVSMSERTPEKSRKGRYVIEDHFINFWFRFVESHLSLIELGEEKRLFSQVIQPQLSTYMGKIFEDICQQYIMRYGAEIGLPLFQHVGSIWAKDYDIDVVGNSIDGTYCFGECKWSSNPLSIKDLYCLLKENAVKTGLKTENALYVLFSSEGFKTDQNPFKDLKLITADHLLDEY